MIWYETSNVGHGQQTVDYRMRNMEPVQRTVWCGTWMQYKGLSDAEHGAMTEDYLMRNMDAVQRTIWCGTWTQYRKLSDAEHGNSTEDHLVRNMDPVQGTTWNRTWTQCKGVSDAGYKPRAVDCLVWDTDPAQWTIWCGTSTLNTELSDMASPTWQSTAFARPIYLLSLLFVLKESQKYERKGHVLLHHDFFSILVAVFWNWLRCIVKQTAWALWKWRPPPRTVWARVAALMTETLRVNYLITKPISQQVIGAPTRAFQDDCENENLKFASSKIVHSECSLC